MTQQEFYLQAAIQIAAALNNALIQRTGQSTPDDRQNVSECAVISAKILLVSAQEEWNDAEGLGDTFGALFDTDPQQVEPNPQEQANNDDYALYVSFGGNKAVMHSIIADNDAQAIEKALDIFERAFVKQGAKHYALKRGGRTIKEG